MALIVVDEIEKVNDLLDHIREYPTLKYMVVMEHPIPAEVKGRAESAGVELLVFTELLELGEQNLRDPVVSIRGAVVARWMKKRTLNREILGSNLLPAPPPPSNV